VTAELSLWSLFWQASFLVQMVMLILIALSVVSWTLIFQRNKLLQQAHHQSATFTKKFWADADLNQLYQEVSSGQIKSQGLANVFYHGLKEFIRLNQRKELDPNFILQGAQRAMRIAASKENDALQKNVSILATIGSVSPYIGLFGTVWGIMHAFVTLGSVQQATLAMVAPPIAEALVATAMGLFAAIPAVIAYNRFSQRIGELNTAYLRFSEELINILQRQVQA
jgi:biopolymer transport protein TolQ